MEEKLSMRGDAREAGSSGDPFDRKRWGRARYVWVRHGRPPAALVGTLVLSLFGAACATHFSPATVRSEIRRQTGVHPPRVFEVSLGRQTMALARRVIGPAEDGSLPLRGLDRFELAVYEMPAAASPVDFTRMPVRGWEPTVRLTTPGRSTVVLVRFSGDAIGDLVLVASDEDQALYARLAGRLPPELPEALGDALADRGTDAVKRELMSLTSMSERLTTSE